MLNFAKWITGSSYPATCGKLTAASTLLLVSFTKKVSDYETNSY